jgi:hypothetical protein
MITTSHDHDVAGLERAERLVIAQRYVLARHRRRVLETPA